MVLTMSAYPRPRSFSIDPMLSMISLVWSTTSVRGWTAAAVESDLPGDEYKAVGLRLRPNRGRGAGERWTDWGPAWARTTAPWTRVKDSAASA